MNFLHYNFWHDIWNFASFGGPLIKVGTDVQTKALGFSGVNFCPGIRF